LLGRSGEVLRSYRALLDRLYSIGDRLKTIDDSFKTIDDSLKSIVRLQSIDSHQNIGDSL
jgi:hypothetical protein